MLERLCLCFRPLRLLYSLLRRFHSASFPRRAGHRRACSSSPPTTGYSLLPHSYISSSTLLNQSTLSLRFLSFLFVVMAPNLDSLLFPRQSDGANCIPCNDPPPCNCPSNQQCVVVNRSVPSLAPSSPLTNILFLPQGLQHLQLQ